MSILMLSSCNKWRQAFLEAMCIWVDALMFSGRLTWLALDRSSVLTEMEGAKQVPPDNIQTFAFSVWLVMREVCDSKFAMITPLFPLHSNVDQGSYIS